MMEGQNTRSPGYPVAPNQGYPVAQNQAYPVAQNQGYPVTPNQGYPVTPTPGYPVTPTPGYPAAPTPGNPVAPTPSGQVDANPDDGYKRSCNKKNPCCANDIGTSAKIFAGVLMVMNIIAACIYITDALYPKDLYARYKCVSSRKQNEDLEHCEKRQKLHYISGEGRDAVENIFYCSIGNILIALLMAITTGIILCKASPGICSASAVGVGLGDLLAIMIHYVIFYNCNAPEIFYLVVLLGAVPIPLWYIWVVFSFRKFLQRETPAPAATSFQPQAALSNEGVPPSDPTAAPPPPNPSYGQPLQPTPSQQQIN